MNNDIKNFTETELKALAYDNLAQIEVCQNNLKTINVELNRRSTQQTAEVAPQGEIEAQEATVDNNDIA